MYNPTTGMEPQSRSLNITDLQIIQMELCAQRGRDLFRLSKVFVSNGHSNGYQVLSAGSIDLMTSFQIPGINNEVALHLFVMDGERTLQGHEEGEQGVASIVGFNLDTKIVAIVRSNQGEADLEKFYTPLMILA